MLLSLKLRTGAVMGCGDCPFRHSTNSMVEAARGFQNDECTVTEPDNTAISPEQKMDALPSWCPLRGGPLTISAEPNSLARNSAGELMLAPAPRKSMHARIVHQVKELYCGVAKQQGFCCDLPAGHDGACSAGPSEMHHHHHFENRDGVIKCVAVPGCTAGHNPNTYYCPKCGEETSQLASCSSKVCRK